MQKVFLSLYYTRKDWIVSCAWGSGRPTGRGGRGRAGGGGAGTVYGRRAVGVGGGWRPLDTDVSSI